MQSPEQSVNRYPRKQRRRPPRSCQECRRRKVKCDLKQPCSHCSLSLCPCEYDVNTARTSRATADEPSSSTQRVFPLATSPQLSTSRPTPSSTVNTQDVDNHGAPTPTNHEWERLKRRIQRLEEQLFTISGGAIHAASIPTTSSSPQKYLTLNKSRLFGRSHWTHGGHQFRRTALIITGEYVSSDDETTKCLKAEIRTLLQKCKVLARSLKRSLPSRDPSWVETSLDLPYRDFADRMTRIYVTRFESAFRILHIPSFWAEYDQFWRVPSEVAQAVQHKIKLVVAIGSSLYREDADAEKVYLTARQWVHAAQHWLSGLLEKNRVSIDGLQIQCLLILARQTLSISGDLVWIAIGTLLRTAMQMGLHRDPKHFKKMTTLHAEVRRRLWATIMEMNIQGALDAGVTATISLDDFDTAAPSDVNDSDIDESTKSFPQQPTGLPTDVSLQRLLFTNLRSRLEILRRMNGVGSDFSPDEIYTLTSQISSACRECGTYIQQGNVADAKAFRQNLVDLLLRRFLITLHRPQVSSAFPNAISYFSRKVCLDSATALLYPLPDEDFAHLVLLGGGVFKNRIIHASLAVASELLIELEEHSAMQWPSAYRKMLVEALKEAIRQTAGRIKLGETKVILHMKLNTVLRQAESTESGVALQLDLVRAAKESLDISFATLEARLTLGLQTDGNTSPTLEFDEQDFDFSMGPELDDLFRTADFEMDGTLGSNAVLQ